MANPAPTINQINAFNATQGTIIDFNIIGGTELVRSNRIYIYDLSDNSLICTHLYVSTESIHELPANTDSSIVYESGKSSADFVNGAQYYAQIQTYTDTAGTEGGSGISVAKMFWCLVDPTLTITTIPSTISTTSYNVSATYTDTSASVVSNIIQQYQFSLYSATGSLLQSSGVVVGSGTQQGASTAYDISYNFTGLSVGSSYYVVVDVTTTQGMNVSTQSNTFTVSIDTPTLGEATVVNNACDGYISVTSNLSGEYGGSASGEIATFETDSVNDVSSLKVTLAPQQDATPWIGTDHDTTPYLHRAMPTQSNSYNRENGVIVGGTVGWNQLVEHGDFDDISGWQKSSLVNSISVASNVLTATINGGQKDVSWKYGVFRNVGLLPVGDSNHHYLCTLDINPSVATSMRIELGGGVKKESGVLAANSWSTVAFIAKKSIYNQQMYMYPNSAVNDVTAPSMTVQYRNVNLFDLTAMFGSTIADYIYNLEQSSAGAGVAWFRKLFPKDYYEYNSGELLSVEGLESHDTVGFNQWDEEWESGDINVTTNGMNHVNANRIRTKNYIPVFPNTTYYFKCGYGNPIVAFYDENKTYVSNAENVGYKGVSNTTFTTPSWCRYIRAYWNSTTYNHDICINLSKTTGSPKNGDYVPHEKHTYPLDSSLTLRGIPKIANGNLYYDGDEYESDGTVTRRIGTITFDGSENWVASSNANTYYVTLNSTTFPYRFASDVTASSFSEFSYKGTGPTSAGIADKQFYLYVGSDSSSSIRETAFKDSACADLSAWKAKLQANPITVIYETPTTTETAQAYTNPQVVDPDGTEEYVTANNVPVGHDSTYSLVCPISGYDEVSAWRAGCAVTDNSTDFIELPYPIENGETYGFSTLYPSAGDSHVMFYDENKTYVDWWTTTSHYPNESQKTNTYNKTIKYVKLHPTSDSYTKTHYVGVRNISKGEEYNFATYTTDLPQTVYGGTLDVVSGVLTVDRLVITRNTADMNNNEEYPGWKDAIFNEYFGNGRNVIVDEPLNIGELYGVNTVAAIGAIWLPISTYGKTQSEWIVLAQDIQITIPLATPQTYQLTPQQIQTLVGTNNVWSEQGNIELSYHIPITNLLVKRQDVADVSGSWLTLYSQPVTQASDMDFTFIDFLNQYGKTYKYALVPLLTQTQSGVEVEVEGGYTVSDEVQSIFDGVFIADQTGSQKCKANVGYGDVDMNQAVGTITPIGAKYPIVITNSRNQYHNGSISGTIVPDDYYFNGNLSRIDMVNKRNELEQFLTNKRAKIIKDWNSNIWLVMITENINCSFNNEYGMGLVNFNANWIEVGDPTNQQDLQAAGLIDVGGV